MALLFLATPALADSPLPPALLADTPLADTVQESEARSLMATLRCVVCQGQSIADSNAELAGDMRALVRDRIRRGQSSDQVRTWLIGRYGDYVSYDPPFGWATWPLWLAPLALLVVGLSIARASFRRRR